MNDIYIADNNIVSNKGFSMVELIIVVAIMAILAGALAPALIKYINKSKISSDVDTGASFARAIMAAVTNDGAYESAEEHSTPHPLNDMDKADFRDEVFKTFGRTEVYGKSKIDAMGDPIAPANRQFYYTLDAQRNRVEVYYGGTTSDFLVYPTVGDRLSN